MNTQWNDRGNLAPGPDRANTPADQALGSLVGGIFTDMQRLLGQHLDLFRQEIRDDVRKTKEAFFSIGLGGVLAVVAALLVLPALIGLLSWAVPAVAWWGWCGILAGVLAVAAFALIQAGKKQMASFNPLPDQSAQAVQENLQWISDRVTSDRP